nr:putative ribonuclease H-like domain-containing protein [Tanacetum cinerariifolium]
VTKGDGNGGEEVLCVWSLMEKLANATNIILEGLPADIYSLVNHHRVSKDLWERVQLLMQGLQVMQKDDGIFISQDKYVADILMKFDFSSVKIASTPIETNKALIKDEEAEDVDVHLYRSMIVSLMYLKAFRPDIIYLKGQPKLGLWYPRDSPFDLEAFSDSDYARASLDMKSTTGGCQFLGKRPISWQCKKQTVVANSKTEPAYIVAANCCGHVYVTSASKHDIYESGMRTIFKTLWQGMDGIKEPCLARTCYYLKREPVYGLTPIQEGMTQS